VAAWRQQLGSSAAGAVAAAARWQRQQLGHGGQLGSGSGSGNGQGKKQQQSTKSSGGNSDGNGIHNDLIQARMRQRLHCSRYTIIFEQSTPV
jgi:hypothetical protein